MENKEKKYLIIISIIAIVSLGLRIITHMFVKSKGEIVVTHQSVEVLRVDYTSNATYKIHGTVGILVLEVKDKKWRIVEADCPNHNCVNTGWVDQNLDIPIICLPNEVIVIYEP